MIDECVLGDMQEAKRVWGEKKKVSCVAYIRANRHSQ